MKQCWYCFALILLLHLRPRLLFLIPHLLYLSSMKKLLKITVLTLLVITLLLSIALGAFVYKVKYGFATYETEPHEVSIPPSQPAVLIYSKATGFRHGESITAAEKVFRELGEQNGWFVYVTEDAGIINKEQLAEFEAIVWNNSTGRTLTDEQRIIVENYVENGGGILGVHGAGDDSHHWPWYNENLLGAKFSHHPIENQLQETAVMPSEGADSLLTANIPASWPHTDEYYVFFEQPSAKGFNYVYQIDGEEIDANGNILFVSDKDFGMGETHPVAWSRNVGEGRTFYTSLGHNAAAISNPPVRQLLRNAISWVMSN